MADQKFYVNLHKIDVFMSLGIFYALDPVTNAMKHSELFSCILKGASVLQYYAFFFLKRLNECKNLDNE